MVTVLLFLKVNLLIPSSDSLFPRPDHEILLVRPYLLMVDMYSV
jgi:hypothetical protein